MVFKTVTDDYFTRHDQDCPSISILGSKVWVHTNCPLKFQKHFFAQKQQMSNRFKFFVSVARNNLKNENFNFDHWKSAN